MFLSKVIHVLISATFLGQATPAPEQPLVIPQQAMIDEILSYECAKSVSTMIQTTQQAGPLFSDGLLTLTSVEARDGSNVLILNAGAGTYAVKLDHEGVNRLRFSIPTHLPGGPMSYFVSYMHGTLRMSSRVFEISMHRPPPGKEETDYSAVQVSRSVKMLEHFDYAIFTTAGKMLEALMEGRINRSQMEQQRAQNCENIARTSPALAKILRRDLDQVEMMVMGPRTTATASRMPASL